jgi:sulfane dehydrogenase subunit SoxC
MIDEDMSTGSGSPTEGGSRADRRVLTRRALIAGGAAALGGVVLHTAADALSQVPGAGAAQAATDGNAAADPTKIQGELAQPVGQRAPSVDLRRSLGGQVSFTPLEGLDGIITPADLHFERHHAGIPAIDPDRYRLMIHGMVDRPTSFSLADLKRFPRTSHLGFLECSGNGGRSVGTGGQVSPQQLDGLLSTSEWVGVSLPLLLEEVGADPDATWVLAEGSDAAVLTRSIPMEKARSDAIVAYMQNGEPIRPAQGFPARLLLPGWEGNTNVKWLRRLEVGDGPWMSREETAHYTDPMADGTSRMFSMVMDAKSLITFPAFPAVLPETGWWEITGLAWSGRGKVARVEVTTDGGGTWEDAVLQEPVLPRCATRFRHLWRWDGGEVTLQSRATDETGNVQPSYEEFVEVRGPATRYHYNQVRGWQVAADGNVTYWRGA